VKPPSPSFEDISARINNATTLRDANILSKTSKIADRFERAAKTKEVLAAEEEQKIKDMEKALSEKMAAAEANFATNQQLKVQALHAHHDTVHVTATTTAASNEAQRMALAAQTFHKQQHAMEQRENVIVAKVVNVAIHNEAVRVTHANVLSEKEEKLMNLEENITAKQAAAATNHEALILSKVMDLGTATRDKTERGKFAMSVKESHTDELSKDIKERMARAEVNRDVIIAEKVKSAVKKPRSPTKPDASNANTVESINARLDEASVRRDGILADKVKSASKKPRSPTKKNGDDCTADSISEKLEEAASRREILLQQKSEQCGMHAAHVMEVASAVKANPSKRCDTPSKILHNDDEVLPGAGEALDMNDGANDGTAEVDNLRAFDVGSEDVKVDLDASQASVDLEEQEAVAGPSEDGGGCSIV
jgi:hypothetical protein